MTDIRAKFAPSCFEIGFLECDAETASQTYLSWMRPIQDEQGVQLTIRSVFGDVRARLESLLPLTNMERRRFLFLPTRGNWTAYIDNGAQGTDAFSAISYLAQVIECRGVRAVSVPDSIQKRAAGSQGDYGANILEIYAPRILSEGHNTLRSVFAANDGGTWSFAATGQQFEFEETSQYSARRIRDRFTSEMLDRYLQALGIHFFSETFYEVSEPAYLINKEGPCMAGMRCFPFRDKTAVPD